MRYDPHTYAGRQAMMEERDRLYRHIWAEQDANGGYEEDESPREQELASKLQSIHGALYDAGMMETAFNEHEARKG